MQDSLRGAEHKIPKSVRRTKRIVGRIRVSHMARLIVTRVMCDTSQRLVGIRVAHIIKGGVDRCNHQCDNDRIELPGVRADTASILKQYLFTKYHRYFHKSNMKAMGEEAGATVNCSARQRTGRVTAS